MYRRLYFLYAWNEARDDPNAPPQVRYRLEDAATHEQHLFVEPDALAEFLRAQNQNGREWLGERKNSQ